MSAALLALVTHIQVLPALNTQTYDVNGAVLYAEPSPTTRYSVKVTHSDITGYKVQLGVKWRF